MMYDYFEIYPADHRKGMEYIDKPMWHPLYFVEFTRWKKGDKMHWRLFKKCFIFTREEWNKKLLENPEELSMMTITGNEGHPYQLSNGEVNENPGVIQMDTMAFLKYMVDALNAKALQDEFIVGLAQEIQERARLGDIIEENGMELTPEQIENLPPELKKHVKKESAPITGGDLTQGMVPLQTDGGGTILVNETELPDYPRDGQQSA